MEGYGWKRLYFGCFEMMRVRWGWMDCISWKYRFGLLSLSLSGFGRVWGLFLFLCFFNYLFVRCSCSFDMNKVFF